MVVVGTAHIFVIADGTVLFRFDRGALQALIEDIFNVLDAIASDGYGSCAGGVKPPGAVVVAEVKQAQAGTIALFRMVPPLQ